MKYVRVDVSWGKKKKKLFAQKDYRIVRAKHLRYLQKLRAMNLFLKKITISSDSTF